jgi:glucan phosphoethanolaminetransferase (alkaline phosphatase superfamily)
MVTLIVSIIGTITFIDRTAFEKLGIGLLINLQFHLTFQFLSRVPFAMIALVENDRTWKRRLVLKILTFFSVFIMFGAVIAFIGMLKSVISNHQYSRLIVTMTFLAMFLGGLSLNLKSRQI